MAVQAHPKQQMTATEFDAFALRPENADKLLEFIGGEVTEVPSNPFVSKIAGIIFGEIYIFLKANDLGHLTGESGGYMVGGDRVAPDVAFISYTKQPELARQGYNPNPPDLVVEVLSDPDNAEEQARMRVIVSNYTAAGVVVWVVNYLTRIFEVHQPGQPARILGEDETLDGGDILPGFKLVIKDVFPKKNESETDETE